MSGAAALLRANALEVPLADASVDLMVTSPPYFALRSYRDDGTHYDGQLGSEATPETFLLSQWAVADEVHRTLKPEGSAWWNYGDKMNGSKSLHGMPWRFVLGLTEPLYYRDPIDPPPTGGHPRWILRAEVVWHKPNGLPESVTDRVRRTHETWFHTVKSQRYYAAVDELRQPSQRVYTGRQDGTAHHRRAIDAAEGHHRYDVRMNHPLGKLPGSVWAIPHEPLYVPEHVGVDHFAAFPQEWPRRLILGWSPSGICRACGEGRRPVVDVEYLSTGYERNGSDQREEGRHRLTKRAGDGSVAQIRGYSCACPDTSAPTRAAVVLDPFGGTGTTAMVARALGRLGVYGDLSADYLRLARWRIYESGHAAKTAARTDRERQLSLF